jgi:hypothetical protein
MDETRLECEKSSAPAPSASSYRSILPVEGRPFRVDGLVGSEALHCGRIVALAQAVLAVPLVDYLAFQRLMNPSQR